MTSKSLLGCIRHMRVQDISEVPIIVKCRRCHFCGSFSCKNYCVDVRMRIWDLQDSKRLVDLWHCQLSWAPPHDLVELGI